MAFKGAFLTLLFPIDRFGEMGPLSRCYFKEKGFCRQDILEHIWAFYQVSLHSFSPIYCQMFTLFSVYCRTYFQHMQEYMTPGEIEVALYTDSKHADKLRTAYASKEAISLGHVSIRRFEFLGSRKSFEGLKRVSRENTSHVYELLLAA